MNLELFLAVKELKLSKVKKSVLLVMALCADSYGDNASPTVPNLAHDAGYSVRQVQRAIGDLRDSGILMLTAEGGRAGQQPNTYSIDLSKLPLSPISLPRKRPARPLSPGKARSSPGVTRGPRPVTAPKRFSNNSKPGDMGDISYDESDDPDDEPLHVWTFHRSG
jgi:hypothetical protein